MQKYFENITDRNGSVIPGAIVTVTLTATGALATIYSDNGVTPRANPITCDNNGYFEFFAADGRYTLTINGAGIQARTISDVLLEDLDDLTGDEGASRVGYTPAGTGAVATTVQAKLREAVSVADFGGSAGVDCAAALVLAAAATTGPVVIPAGAWTCTATTSNSATILGLLDRIRCDGTLTINLTAGTHGFTEPVTVSSAEVQGLSILGAAPVSLSITGQVSVSGSAGAYSVVLQVSTVAGVAVGDYLHTYDATGTGYPAIHRGGWEITNVDAVNTRITVKNTCRAAAFPTNTITSSNSVALKTVLSFANCDGFVVMGSRIDFINNVAVVGNSDSYWSSANVTGTEKGTHGFVIGANTIALNGKPDNVNPYGISAANVSCGPNVAINGFDQQGVVVENGGTFYGNYVSACNNKRRGFYASTGAAIRAKHITANGNYLDGVIIDIGGSIYASSVSAACGNGSRGVSATQPGCLVFDTGIMTNNGTDGGAAVEGAVLQATSSISSGNGRHGFYAEYNGTIYCDSSTIDGNVSQGIYAALASTFRAPSVVVTNNGAFGIRCEDYSVILHSGSTVTGNVSGSLSLTRAGLVIDGGTVLSGRLYGEDARLRNLSTLKGVRIAPGSGGDTFNFQYDTAGTETYSTAYVMASNSNGFYPLTDNAHLLGRSGNRWKLFHGENVSLTPPASATPANNGEVMFQLTSNTQLTFKVKGSDGTVRSGSITLA